MTDTTTAVSTVATTTIDTESIPTCENMTEGVTVATIISIITDNLSPTKIKYKGGVYYIITAPEISPHDPKCVCKVDKQNLQSCFGGL